MECRNMKRNWRRLMSAGRINGKLQIWIYQQKWEREKGNDNKNLTSAQRFCKVSS